MCAPQEAKKSVAEETIKIQYVAAKEAEQVLAEVRKYRPYAEQAKAKEEAEKAKVSENKIKLADELKFNALLVEIYSMVRIM